MPLPPPRIPAAIEEIADQARRLTVSEGHRLWWTEQGDAGGTALLVLHGGPGGRTRAPTLDWWRNLPLRVLAFDQRGCGRSEPRGSLQCNTLAALVQDIEALRVAAGVERWAIAGGSWGARLALAYAASHPQRVSGLFLRSPFLGALAETSRYIEPWFDWLDAIGQAWLGAAATQALSKLYRGELGAFGADTGLTRSDAQPPTLPAVLDDARLAAAWAAFDEAQNLAGGARLDGRRFTAMAAAGAETLASWRIHATHALAGWGCADPALGAWPEALALRAAWSGPVSIVAGADDACCDPHNAVRLAALWPQAVLALVPGAGHRLDDPALAPVLAAAARDFGPAIIAALRSPPPHP